MSAKKKLARQKFRDDVLKRDRNRCVICKAEDNIEAHHITDRELMPGGGYVKENGISLCHEHVEMAEAHRVEGGEEAAKELAPEKLYIKVGSNYDKALAASQRLEGH
ncbi:MAG: hypothetical protein V7752_13210 [Halopseudomonas sp.]